MARTLREVLLERGGGVKGRAIKEKITFFGTFFCQRSKISTAIKLEGEGAGGYALMGRPFREELFFAASLKFQGKNAYSLTYLLGIRPSVANSTSRRIRKSKCLKAYMVCIWFYVHRHTLARSFNPI